MKDMPAVSVLGTVPKQLRIRVQLVKPKFIPLALDFYNCDRLARVLGEDTKGKAMIVWFQENNSIDHSVMEDLSRADGVYFICHGIEE